MRITMPVALMRRLLPVATLLLLLLSFFGQPVQARQAPPFNPDDIPIPASPPVTLLGAAGYAQNCAACHGATGASDGPTVVDLPAPPPPFADPATTWAQSPAEYFHITKYGRIENLMPPWENQLTDDEIWRAVYYAWSLHTSAADVAAGATLYAASCASCHGEQGGGDGPDATGALPDFGDQETMTFVTDAALSQGWDAAHPAMGGEWSEEERRQTLNHIRTFTYAPPWESPFTDGDGIVRGTLVQGTQAVDAPSPLSAGIPVALYGFVDFTQVVTATASSAADGAFQFENLPTAADIAYVAEATYAGVPYSSDFFNLTDAAPEFELELPVYATSDDAESVTIARANWIIDHQPGALLVGQILVYSNAGDRTFSGMSVDGIDRPVTAAIPVPPNAVDLDFPDGVIGGRYVRLDDMVYDTAPIPPGEAVRQIFASYRLPYSGTAATPVHRWLYPVESLNLLVAELPGVEVDAAGLTYVDNDVLEGVEFQLWTGAELAAGSAVAVELTGLLTADAVDPRAATSGDATAGDAANPPRATAAPLEPWLPLTLGVLATLTLGALFAIYTRRAAAPSTLMAAEQDELIRQIAELDDRHARAEISEAEWTTTRARLKARLLETAQQLTTVRQMGD